MSGKLIQNAFMCNDGKILVSNYRHNYVSYKEADGTYHFTDGGLSYVRRSISPIKEDLTLYENDGFSVIREKLLRGTYGKNCDEDLHYVRLKDLSDEWLNELVTVEQRHNPGNLFLKYYVEEQFFRRLADTNFAEYCISLGAASEDYAYPIDILIENISYFRSCWVNNISCYQALENFEPK